MPACDWLLLKTDSQRTERIHFMIIFFIRAHVLNYFRSVVQKLEACFRSPKDFIIQVRHGIFLTSFVPVLRLCPFIDQINGRHMHRHMK